MICFLQKNTEGTKDIHQKKNSEMNRSLSESHSQIIPLLSEERARIYSSDSDEGSEEDKAQRLLKAKKLTSDEVKPHLFNCRGLPCMLESTPGMKNSQPRSTDRCLYTH